ncbi:MAG TPA: hypothetical protein VFS25_20970 [Chitinophaga sp.]|uniref:hypothetical protein n=1 Tax=Chitinophaga sp. TaxID=1869181 RepID=UPI002DB856BC|nr:hypothetical protein [Chitinophaga sp.]HEU4555334.1 hypothetical protein [Chitinophaga sp.]
MFFASDAKSKLIVSANQIHDRLVTPERIKNNQLSGQAMLLINDSIREIHSYRRGEIWGEELISFEDGSPKFYAFKTDSVNSTFHRIYNRQRQIVEEMGDPLVYMLIGGGKTGDTLDVKFVFVDRIFSSMEVECNINGRGYSKIALTTDKEFAPCKVFHYVEDVSGLNRAVLLFKMFCKEMNNGEIKEYRDTLDLSKKPGMADK